jgi:hypothetical protein
MESHYCYSTKDGKVDVSKKRWDHKLQAWVLDLPSSPPAKFWDAEKKDWVTEKDYYGNEVVTTRTKSETKYLGAGTEHNKSYTSSYTSSTSYKTWTPTYPWDNLSMKKWPNAFMNLLRQFHEHSWYRDGKYISEEEWKDRLAGKYKPETKYPISYYAGGYYGDGYDCEG